MQQVVDRKELAYSSAKLKMEQCRSNLEVAREKCMAADASLQECKDKLQGLVAKCSSENNASQPQQMVSEHQLSAVVHLGTLLPPEMAKGFQEALAHIQALMQMQTASAEADIQVDSSENSECGIHTGGSPVAPGGPGAGISQPSSSLSSGVNGGAGYGARAPVNLVLPSGWGRGRGRPELDPAAASTAVPNGERRSRTPNGGGRSDSLDSGARRRLRGKQPNPHARTPSEAPSDGIGHPATGARYFSQAALATDTMK